MIQKRFNKKCHDVFRYQQPLTIAMMIVLQERVYRIGVNLKFGGGDGGDHGHRQTRNGANVNTELIWLMNSGNSESGVQNVS